MEHHCLVGAGSRTTKTKTRWEVGIDEEGRLKRVGFPVELEGCAGYLIVLVVLDEGLGAESSNKCWLGIN
jgi:hypothetical protein